MPLPARTLPTSRRTRRPRPGVAIPLLLFATATALPACRRGWLADWLSGHGVGEDRQSPSLPGSLHLQEVDCPAGLTRCVDGVITVAQAFRHPEPCKGSPEQCTCPWQVIGRCEVGCVADGVSTPIPLALARAQLCATLPGAPPLALPPRIGTVASGCGDEGYRCSGTTVWDCRTKQAVATCARGCAEEEGQLDDPSANEQAAVGILCSR